MIVSKRRSTPMPSQLYTAILEATKRRRSTSGSGSSYGKGWNAAMEEVVRVLDLFEDDGISESRVRYEWAIQNGDGSIHRTTVARTIAEKELQEQLRTDPKNEARLVVRRVVAHLHGDWQTPSEAGTY
jgi:hypothetical protein